MSRGNRTWNFGTCSSELHPSLEAEPNPPRHVRLPFWGLWNISPSEPEGSKWLESRTEVKGSLVCWSRVMILTLGMQGPRFKSHVIPVIQLFFFPGWSGCYNPRGPKSTQGQEGVRGPFPTNTSHHNTFQSVGLA